MEVWKKKNLSQHNIALVHHKSYLLQNDESDLFKLWFILKILELILCMQFDLFK